MLLAINVNVYNLYISTNNPFQDHRRFNWSMGIPAWKINPFDTDGYEDLSEVVYLKR